ncbi:TIGR02530 family flagellar biosynthesis protein [Paenibacillus sp. J2TS4]|uniref:TIGR02530 family flagellar biosynthesis protein n=1 Tax=Paenibacillus sp. J2TS4 TaxID=2807194 RepID=UPI001B1D36D1|nr:TIGR02530 family flagellar biosynthesis protein [Paenibacillus sp. J2TS4]GIP33072.1 flagellar biosynthesis protein [Paenibacillus sp. J2TS4]
MTERFSISQLYPHAIRPASSHNTNGPSAPGKSGGDSFQKLLDQELVKFSHHAEVRLKQRGIRIQPEQMAQIANAVDKAASKGAKDSLIIMNNVALIVNISNKTVVTALDKNSMKDNVFTQIDSAIVLSS